MPTSESLDERLQAVERALIDADTNTDHDLTALRDAAEVDAQLAAHTERLDTLEARVEELEAATQALRGYVGNVRAVNDAVERRADAALAKAESVEQAVGSTDSEAFEMDSFRSVQRDTDRERTPEADDGEDICEGSARGLLARLAGVS
ncbi:DUF7310 family coiled-coil domain-containing protein [Halorussus halophilus]|uniref:DUF7310 family coiled-coil domain-containing protein n=1 Tax=Halorussus halophilus TaxID=2650975 RepID=UPI001300F563|nr:hypothetical protein [Halorussus halophilus]